MPSPITLYDQIASNNRKTLFLVLLFPILLICIITAFCTLAVFIINEKEFTDLGVYTLISHFTGNTEPGWSSLIISIWFLGGVQLASIGLVGQYVGKIYVETKNRPRFNIEKHEKGDKS